MQSSDEIRLQIQQSFNIALSEDWYNNFVDYIQELINHQFDKLIQLLYTIDVNEYLLKQSLNHEANTANIIADLIIQRIAQKIEAKKMFPLQNKDCNEEKL